jgi:guanine deaminase
MHKNHEEWMRQAIALALENVRSGAGGPFGALVVKDDRILASGVNSVTSMNDPTAHAEIVAIRAACRMLKDFQLTGCFIYTTCEPCPMCLGAIYWARPAAYYFSCTRQSAAEAGFDDAFIYDQLNIAQEQRSIPGHCILPGSAKLLFNEWKQSLKKVPY